MCFVLCRYDFATADLAKFVSELFTFNVYLTKNHDVLQLIHFGNVSISV